MKTMFCLNDNVVAATKKTVSGIPYHYSIEGYISKIENGKITVFVPSTQLYRVFDESMVSRRYRE